MVGLVDVSLTNSGILVVSDSVLDHNEADFFGAGIENTFNIALFSCQQRISNNSVDYSGGGINSSSGPDQTVIITSSSIMNNNGVDFGGGLSGQFADYR